MATEQEALEIMEVLEVEHTPEPAGLTSLVTPAANDIPA